MGKVKIKQKLLLPASHDASVLLVGYMIYVV